MSTNYSDEHMTRMYDQYVDGVYRACFLASRNTVDTQNGVRQVFLRLAEHNKVFDSVRQERLWILLQCFTAASRRRDADWACPPGAQVFSAMLEGLLALPPEHRKLLFLHDYEGFSNQELANSMHRSTVSIRAQLKAIRRKWNTEADQPPLTRPELRQELAVIQPSPDQRKQMLYAILEALPEANKAYERRRKKKRWFGVGAAAVLLTVLAGLGAYDQYLRQQRIAGLYDEYMTESYDALLRQYRQGIKGKWNAMLYAQKGLSALDTYTAESIGYALPDLDGNGVRELVIVADKTLAAAYTMEKDELVCLITDLPGHQYRLVKGGLISDTVSLGMERTDYRFYRLAGTALVEEQRVSYENGQENASPWFVGFQRVRVTQDQARQILNSYPDADVPLRLLIE